MEKTRCLATDAHEQIRCDYKNRGRKRVSRSLCFHNAACCCPLGRGSATVRTFDSSRASRAAETPSVFTPGERYSGELQASSAQSHSSRAEEAWKN
uniref:Uncharacterized protein n=1 Tax=Anguilla anguilla TaxID=7936 RepID=A0A0E9PUG7_ANGAN